MHLLGLYNPSTSYNPYNLKFMCNYESRDGVVYMSLIRGIRLDDTVWSQLWRDIKLHSEMEKSDIPFTSTVSNINHKFIIVEITHNHDVKRIIPMKLNISNSLSFICANLSGLLYADFSVLDGKCVFAHVVKCHSLKLIFTSCDLNLRDSNGVVHVILNDTYKSIDTKSLIV